MIDDCCYLYNSKYFELVPLDKNIVRRMESCKKLFKTQDVHALEKGTKFNNGNGKMLFIDWTAMDSYCNLKMEDSKMEYYYNFLDQFENKCIVLEDLHCWSYDVWENLSWHLHSTYKRIYNFMHRFKIYYCTSMYECPEFKQISDFYSFKNIYIIPHHFNSEEFRDFGKEKIYDIFMYGNIDPKLYKFRNRLFKILDGLKNMGVKIKTIDRKDGIRGAELGKLINQAYISVATTSDYDYMVAKYFEIAACNTVILGNTNKQGKGYFKDDMIVVDKEMSDDDIKKKIVEALMNKNKLKEMAKRNMERMEQYKITTYGSKLVKIYNEVKNNKKEKSNYRKTIELHNNYDKIMKEYTNKNVDLNKYSKIVMKKFDNEENFKREFLALDLLKDYTFIPNIVHVDFKEKEIYCEYFGEKCNKIETKMRETMREMCFKIKKETGMFHNNEYLENLYIKDDKYYLGNFEKADYTWVIYPKYLKDNDNYPPNHILNIDNCLGENNKNPQLSKLLNEYYS